MIEFFKYIFYGIGLIALMYETAVLTQPKRAHNFMKRYKEATKQANTKGKSYKKALSIKQQNFTIVFIGYVIWTFVGLLTAQWIGFAFIIILSIIPKPYWSLRWMDALITTCTLAYIILNAIHYHFDTFELLKSLFS